MPEHGRSSTASSLTISLPPNAAPDGQCSMCGGGGFRSLDPVVFRSCVMGKDCGRGIVEFKTNRIPGRQQNGNRLSTGSLPTALVQVSSEPKVLSIRPRRSNFLAGPSRSSRSRFQYFNCIATTTDTWSSPRKMVMIWQTAVQYVLTSCKHIFLSFDSSFSRTLSLG